jgi:hypothetical protein
MTKPLNKGDKVQWGDTKGTYAEKLTKDTVVNGQKIEASVADPKARVVNSSGKATAVDTDKVSKRV